MSDSDSYKDSLSDEEAVDPTKEGTKKKEIDPAKNPDDQNSFSGSSDKDKNYDDDLFKIKNNKSDKGSDDGEEDEEDKKRNEVRKEFTLEFEKKIAKYIPPKIVFEGDLRKRALICTKLCEDKYSSGITIFKNYFLYTAAETLKILNKNLKLVYSSKIVDNGNEIFNLSPINDESIIIVASDKVRIINLNVEKEEQISYEIIQEIKENELPYCFSKILNNGYLLLSGGDRAYYFYDLEKKGKSLPKIINTNLLAKLMMYIMYMMMICQIV